MKGILYKDLMTIRKTIWIYVALVVLLAGFGSDYQLMFAMIYSLMLPVNILAYDERSHFERLLSAMPVNGLACVTDKYLIGYASIAFALMVALVRSALFPGYAVPAWLMLASVAMALLAVSIVLPIMFRLGTEKGRMVYLLAIGVQMAAYFVLAESTQGMPTEALTAVWLAVLAASAAVNAGSVCVSNALYTRRLSV